MQVPDGHREETWGSSPDRQQGTAQAESRNVSVSDRVILAVGCAQDVLRAVEEHLHRDMDVVEVLSARTGSEALRLIRERPVDIIMLSVGIPDVDARDLFTTLRETTETATTPVLFMGKRVTDSVRHHPCRMAFDGDMEETAAHAEVAGWLARRLHGITPEDRMGKVDTLTGLPNRAAFCTEFEQASATCHAAREPIALAVLHLDLQGDASPAPADLYARVIALWAHRLTASLRATDYLARWDAGAFVLLLSGEDTVGATRAVDRAFASCRPAILEACGQHASRLTLCAGVTSVTPGMSVAHAVASAERYLFSAKSAGGNRVVSSDSRLYRRPVQALVLIDDKLMGRVICGLLDQEELKVIHAENLDAAREACGGRRRFQLIVIDEALDGEQGFNALEQIKALPGTRTVPTIMLLAELSEARIADALELGATDYVGRPFSPLPFVSRVRKLLEIGVFQHSASIIPHRILIIEHSMEDLILAGTTLDQHDSFIPYLAYDAKDASERLATQPVDIILAPLDMLKQERRGFLNLCGTPLPHDIAIVGISKARDDGPSEGYDKRISGVIRKPFNVLTLGREIEQLTGISTTVKSNEEDSNHISDEIQRVLTLFGPPTGAGARAKSPSPLPLPARKAPTIRLADPRNTDPPPKWKWF